MSSSLETLIAIPKQSIGDMSSGETRLLSVERGTMFWLSWADRKRQYSKSVKVEGVETAEIYGVTPDRSGAVRT